MKRWKWIAISLPCVAALVSSCSKAPAPAALPPTVSPTQQADAPAAQLPASARQAEPAAVPQPESPVERIRKATSLAGAIEIAKPFMSDTVDKPSDGTLLLSIWAGIYMTLADVSVPKNETSIGLIMKDSDEERGKRACYSGQIIQIAREKTELPTIRLYSGLLLSGSNILSFVVSGSTGALVSRSRAKLCGVVIGRYDYGNSAGGTGHAVAVVGMFDIPENRPQ